MSVPMYTPGQSTSYVPQSAQLFGGSSQQSPVGNALQGAAGGAVAGPYGAIAGGVGSLLGGMFAEDQRYPQSYDINPGQRALWERMYGQYQSGAGDFGGGQTARTGYGNLMQMLGGRGIDPRSGAAVGAMGNVASNAAATDSQRRDDWGRSLLNSQIQQATRYV